MMKTLLTTATLLLCLTLIGQTTQEEYNYMVKGYKIQLESGLDMKKGYVFIEDKKLRLEGGVTVTIKMLAKDTATAPRLVGYLIVYQDANGTGYFGVPTVNAAPELIKQSMEDMVNFWQSDYTYKRRDNLRYVTWVLACSSVSQYDDTLRATKKKR